MDPLAELVHDMMAFSVRPARVGDKSYVLHTCDSVPREFWALWRDHKEELKDLGFRVNKNEENDSFVVKHWEAGDGIARATLPIRRPQQLVLPGIHYLAHGHDILKSYQIPAASTLIAGLQAHRFVLDGSETGLGKTYTACATAKNLGMNVGVVCPASVTTKWEDTLVDVFDIDPEFVLSYDKARQAPDDFLVRIDRKWRGKDITDYRWNTTAPVLLIFDEIQKCSGNGTLNSKLLHATLRDPFIWTLGLSATVAEDPRDMLEVGYALGLHSGKNWWDWCLANGCRPGTFGGLDFSSHPGSRGEAALNAIHQHIYPARGCRLRRQDLGDAILKSEIFVEIIDTGKLDKRVIDELEAVMEAEVRDAEKALEKGTDVCAFTTTLRDRQRAELAKVPTMADKAVDLLKEGWSVPVFLNFHGSIALFDKLMPKDVWRRHFHGQMSSDARKKGLADFQANKAHLLLVQMDSGSDSVDMHDVHGGHPRASLISPGYDARKLQQALGRVDRLNAKTNSIQFIVFGSDSVEKRIARIVQSKLGNMSRLNNGDLSGVPQLI